MKFLAEASGLISVMVKTWIFSSDDIDFNFDICCYGCDLWKLFVFGGFSFSPNNFLDKCGCVVESIGKYEDKVGEWQLKVDF